MGEGTPSSGPGAPTASSWCPRCGASSGTAVVCTQCGARLDDPAATDLRQLDVDAARLQHDLVELRARQAELQRELRSLGEAEQRHEHQLQTASSRRAALLARLPTTPAPPPPGLAPPAPPGAATPPPPTLVPPGAPPPPVAAPELPFGAPASGSVPRPGRAGASLPPPPLAAPTAPAGFGAYLPPSQPRAPRRPPRTHRPEWRTATLGNILLGLGTILLTIAALVFATVTWQTLTDAQRALVLLGVTAICGTGTMLLHNRLRNTAEAFGVLFVTFIVVDWYAMRRAGIGGSVDLELWWSLGLAIGACASIVVWLALKMRVQRVLAPLLATTSAVLLAGFGASLTSAEDAAFALLMAVVASAAVIAGAAIDDDDWHITAVTFTIAALPVELLVIVGALATLDTSGAGLLAGLAISSIGVAPAVARMIRPDGSREPFGTVLVTAASASFAGGLVIGFADVFVGTDLAAAAAVLGLAIILLARYGPRELTKGSAITGATVLGGAGFVALAPLAAACVAPLVALNIGWDGLDGRTATAATELLRSNGAAEIADLVVGWWASVVVGCFGAAAVVGWAPNGERGRPVPGPIALAVVLASATGVIVLLPLSLGAPVAAIVTIELVAATTLLLGAVHRPESGAAALATASTLAAALGGSALLWGLLDPWLTVGALAATTAVTGLAVVSTRVPGARLALSSVSAVAWLLLGLAAPAALGQPAEIMGLTLTVTAAAAMLVATDLLGRLALPRRHVWWMAGTGLALGAALALAGWSDQPWIGVAAMGVVSATLLVDAIGETASAARRSVLAVGTGSLATTAGLVALAAGAGGAWAGATATLAGGAAVLVAAHLLIDRPIERPGVLAGGTAVLLTAPLVALSGWPQQRPWAAVTALAVVGLVSLAAAPRALSPSLRGVTVAGGAVVAATASCMAAVTWGASQATTGFILAAEGGVALVVATAVLGAADATRAMVQRVALAVAAGTAGSIGVVLAYVGTGLAATSGSPAQGWSTQPWFTVGAVGLLGLGAAVAAVRAPEPALRAALIAAAAGAGTLEPGLVIAAAGGAAAWAAVGVTAAGSLALVGVVWLPRHRSEHDGLERSALAIVAALATLTALIASVEGWTSGQHRWATVTAIALVAAMLAALYPRVGSVYQQAVVGSAGLLAVLDAGLVTSAGGATAPQAALAAAWAAGALLVASPYLSPAPRSPAALDAVEPPGPDSPMLTHPVGMSALVPVAYLGMFVALLVAVTGERLVSATPSTLEPGWTTEPWITVMVVAVMGAAPLAALRDRTPDAVRALFLTTAAAAIVADPGLAVAALGGQPGLEALAVTAAAAIVLTGGALVLRRADDRDVTLAVGGLGLVGGMLLVARTWPDDAWLGVASVAVAAAATGAAALRQGNATVRRSMLVAAGAAAIATAGMIAPAAGAERWYASLGMVVAAGMLIGIGVHVRRLAEDGRLLEVVGLAGLGLGIVLTVDQPMGLAVTLTVAVPLLGIAGAAPKKVVYRAAAAGVALLATWAWLWVGDVTNPEAYTVPAAALALAGGLTAHRRWAEESSWVLFGPALLLGLAPSLWFAVTDVGIVRPVALLTAGVVVVLVGARERMQAPIVAGATTVVVLAIDALWPVASQAPRWIIFAIAGALFLWLGATIERRLRQARQLRDTFGHLH